MLIVDDLLATGGTAAATVGLVRGLGADVVGVQFLIELTFLNGREKLTGENIGAVLRVLTSDERCEFQHGSTFDVRSCSRDAPVAQLDRAPPS